jgi:hypothetical protein
MVEVYSHFGIGGSPDGNQYAEICRNVHFITLKVRAFHFYLLHGDYQVSSHEYSGYLKSDENTQQPFETLGISFLNINSRQWYYWCQNYDLTMVECGGMET